MSTSSPVEVRQLRKSFRGRVALDGLDLTVPAGVVHGFLGPNGSGKTTTLRALVGLVRPDSGSMRLLGEPVPDRLDHIIDRVGSIIESPHFFDNQSGRLNLSLLAQAIKVPQSRVDEVLAEVGLADAAKVPFKGYSLGMKQRLAIAAVLMKRPAVVILDEPTNGLDPAGIQQTRQVMRRLAASGTSVLVSSHLLSEVQQVADTVTIIGRGRTLAEGRVDELLAAPVRRFEVLVDDPERASAVLREAGFTLDDPRGDLIRIVDDQHRDPGDVTRVLAGHDLWVRGLKVEQADLEQVFLSLTRDLGLTGPSDLLSRDTDTDQEVAS